MGRGWVGFVGFMGLEYVEYNQLIALLQWSELFLSVIDNLLWYFLQWLIISISIQVTNCGDEDRCFNLFSKKLLHILFRLTWNKRVGFFKVDIYWKFQSRLLRGFVKRYTSGSIAYRRNVGTKLHVYMKHLIVD